MNRKKKLFGFSTLILWLSLFTQGCGTVSVPNVRVYREIPFLDGREGVYVESVTGARGLIGANDWSQKTPYMIMIDPEGWTAIKKSWYQACRMAGKKCQQEVESIDSVIRSLDSLAESVLRLNP